MKYPPKPLNPAPQRAARVVSGDDANQSQREPEPLVLTIETPPPGKKKLSDIPEIGDYPPELNREAFHAWVAYRRRRKPAVNPASYPALMRKLVKMGPPELQAATVEHCIANGYQGLFELKPPASGPATTRGKSRVEIALENLDRRIREAEGGEHESNG